MRVFIASPLSAPDALTLDRNLDYARACLKDSLFRGEAPFASHLLYPQVLDDNSPDDRTTGIDAAFQWLQMSELLVVYLDHGLSPGMTREIEYAHHCGIKVQPRFLGVKPNVETS